MDDNEVMLTTFDNPFNPFEDFRSWFLFDVEKGYYTCSYLARIVEFADDMTEKERNEEVDRAINEILKYDFMGIYLKVTRKQEIQKEKTNENEMIKDELS